MDGVQADETPRLSAKQLENLDLESSLAEKFGSKYASNNKTLTR